METSHVQLSCRLAGYLTSPYRPKKPAALGTAVRVALGQSRRGRQAIECRDGKQMVQKAENSAGDSFKGWRITRRVEETVIPTPSNHPALHRLSPLDQVFPPNMAVPLLLFFTADASGGGASNEKIVQSLKRSLTETLAIFYPMAGRLAQRHPHSSSSGFDISCLDQGALFSEAWADCALSCLYPDFQPHPAFHLLSPLPFSNIPDAILYIQVTYFTCGGFCISVQGRHIVCDGTSLYHFLQSWVEILNGKRNLTLYPIMDSSLLEDFFESNNDKSVLQNPSMHFDSTYNVSSMIKIFHFAPSRIATLKNDAKLVRHPTSYECLVAFLWQNLARVHQYPLNERLLLTSPINVRKRLRPSLPQGYFGNALMAGFTYAKMKDLVGKEGFSYATRCIRDMTSTMKSEYIKLALDSSTEQESLPSLFFAPAANKLLANTWIRMPFGNLNFPWGKPYSSRTYLDPDSLGGLILIVPSSLGKGHFDVFVNLQRDHMLEFQGLIM